MLKQDTNLKNLVKKQKQDYSETAAIIMWNLPLILLDFRYQWQSTDQVHRWAFGSGQCWNGNGSRIKNSHNWNLIYARTFDTNAVNTAKLPREPYNASTNRFGAWGLLLFWLGGPECEENNENTQSLWKPWSANWCIYIYIYIHKISRGRGWQSYRPGPLRTWPVLATTTKEWMN